MAENTKSSRYLVDASFILAFLLPDERVRSVEQTFKEFVAGDCSFYSSPLLPYEVLNSLKMAVFRKRMTHDQAIDLGKAFLTWDIQIMPSTFQSVLELALRENITVYDASYVWLARQKHIPLLTLDKALKTLVSREGRRAY